VTVTKGENPNGNDENGTALNSKDGKKKDDLLDWRHSNTVDGKKSALMSGGGSFNIKKNCEQEVTRTSSKKGKLNRKNTMRPDELNVKESKLEDKSSIANGLYIILPDYTKE